MSIWMNVLGKLRFIGAIHPKILLLQSRVTVSRAPSPSLQSSRVKERSAPNSDAEELRREMLLPKSLYES
jgi:hypothetical protein